MMPGVCVEVISKYLCQLHGDLGASVMQEGCLLSTTFVRPDGCWGHSYRRHVLPDGRISKSDMGDSIGLPVRKRTHFKQVRNDRRKSG